MTIDTFDNCARQEIETMPTDTWTSFEEVTPPDSSNVGEELNIGPCVGMEFESIEKVRKFYTSFAKRNGFGYVFNQVKQR